MTCPVKGDKIARALAVQPILSQGLVYAPNLSRADQMISDAESFPKGRFDDLVDSMTQALKYLRDHGMAFTARKCATRKTSERRMTRGGLGGRASILAEVVRYETTPLSLQFSLSRLF
jgi:hypothetical protein